MAFKLTKDQQTTRTRIVRELTAAKELIDAAFDDYNSALQSLAEFKEEVVGQAQEDFGDKSDKWQEGERGEAAQGWIDAWDNLDCDDLELPDTAHAEQLEELPIGVGDL